MSENHEVKQGDTIIKIAHQKGFRNWETIWQHGKNAELRNKRSNPNILFPGDKVFIPDKEPKEHNCATNKRHTFIVPTLVTHVRIILEDVSGNPYDSKDYKLTVDEEDFNGKTDSSGLMEEEVPVGAKEGKLTLWPDENDLSKVMTWSLKIGHLDPIDEVSGAQARLNNLGFDCGEVTGELNDQTKQAIIAFQKHCGLDSTGDVDDKTKKALLEKHDQE